MTNLKLSSNFSGNQINGVGGASLENNNIHISTEPGTTVELLRGINKVILIHDNGQKQEARGSVLLNDVYTLANNDRKLIIKVEAEETTHTSDLFISTDPVFEATSTKRKTTLTAGILILLLLVVSVVFGVQQKKLKTFNSQSEERLTVAISNFDKALAESSIDKNSSRDLFVSSKEVATKLKEDGYKNEKLTKLLEDINTKESEMLGEIKAEPKELLDLTLQINGFTGSKLSSNGETMFIFDEKEKNVIKVDVNGKNAEIVAKKDVLDGANSIASYEERLFTLNNDGVYEIDVNRTKIKDVSWGDSLFYLYSGNIYLVDKTANQIYRFAGNNKTFSDKSEWIAPGIEADFSKIVDMTIDGSIWLLSSSGKVTRFTNGNPTSISMSGIVNQLENPTAIYTNEDLKNVYVLDKQNGRVVVLEKNGNFKIQYVSDKIKEATDLVVSEKEGKIILLSGSKLNYISI